MIPRFLFGPTTAEFADSRLGEVRRAGACLAFGPEGVDLTFDANTCWTEIAAQFPRGWCPDVIALWLNYAAVPAGFWSAPAPLVGLATDWNLLWHELRHVLPPCGAVLTDGPGVEVLARASIEHVHPAVLYGAAPEWLVERTAGERDIDILFVGNLHPAVQRERLPWLGRIARLAGRWNVVIRTGISGAESRALLARAKIAFNRSIRSEANMRAFEAAAAGALLFQEAGNRELPEHFADRRERVYYRDEDVDELLEHYLTDEHEGLAIAEAARTKVASCTFPSLLGHALEALWVRGDGGWYDPSNVYVRRLEQENRHRRQRHPNVDRLRRHERRRGALRRLQRLGQFGNALPLWTGRGPRRGGERATRENELGRNDSVVPARQPGFRARHCQQWDFCPSGSPYV